MSKHHSHTSEAHDSADAWHQHSADEHPQSAHGEVVAVPEVLAYGTVCFLIVVVAVVATAVYFFKYAAKLQTERGEQFDLATASDNPAAADPDFAKLALQYDFNKLKGQAENEFNTFGWHDHNHVRIPLRGDGGAFAKVSAEYAARTTK